MLAHNNLEFYLKLIELISVKDIKTQKDDYKFDSDIPFVWIIFSNLWTIFQNLKNCGNYLNSFLNSRNWSTFGLDPFNAIFF